MNRRIFNLTVGIVLGLLCSAVFWLLIPMFVKPANYWIWRYLSSGVLIIICAGIAEYETKKIYNDARIRLQGMSGVVVQALSPSGQVKIGSELWQAIAHNSTTIEIGENVRVMFIDGLKLTVERYE